MSEKTPLIQVDHLKKYYPIKGGIITHVTGNIHAVDDVSFSITEGETLGLVGESGCGKSTIGRQLVGLETPTEGKIYYQGSDISALKSREMHQIRTQLQMVFQDPYSSLNPRKHIYEILSQPMLYHHISTKASIEKDLERLRTAHQKDVEALRREMKEMRTEMRTEIRQMSDDVKDIKENCIRREEFVSHQLKLENKLDRLMEFMMKQGGN